MSQLPPPQVQSVAPLPHGPGQLPEDEDVVVFSLLDHARYAASTASTATLRAPAPAYGFQVGELRDSSGAATPRGMAVQRAAAFWVLAAFAARPDNHASAMVLQHHVEPALLRARDAMNADRTAANVAVIMHEAEYAAVCVAINTAGGLHYQMGVGGRGLPPSLRADWEEWQTLVADEKVHGVKIWNLPPAVAVDKETAGHAFELLTADGAAVHATGSKKPRIQITSTAAAGGQRESHLIAALAAAGASVTSEQLAGLGQCKDTSQWICGFWRMLRGRFRGLQTKTDHLGRLAPGDLPYAVCIAIADYLRAIAAPTQLAHVTAAQVRDIMHMSHYNNDIRRRKPLSPTARRAAAAAAAAGSTAATITTTSTIDSAAIAAVADAAPVAAYNAV